MMAAEFIRARQEKAAAEAESTAKTE